MNDNSIRIKILIVDDLLYVVKNIARILEKENFHVITAMTGNEALEKVKKMEPELITVDQNLPDMKGTELVKQIYELDLKEKPKTIFISANYDRDTIRSIIQLGVDSYLIKPFKKEKLIKEIKKILKIEE